MIQPISPISNIPDSNTPIKETIQTWIVNDIAISLIKNQNTLEYETIDNLKRKVNIGFIEIPQSENLDEIISGLKNAKAVLDTNGIPMFLESYKTWQIGNQEINLIHGPQDLLWHIFCKDTNKTSLFTIQEATAPSSRCYPKTIDLIEEIKANALTKTHLGYLENDFEITCVLDERKIRSEHKRLDYYRRRDAIDSENHLTNIYKNGLGVGAAVGYLGLSASWGSICAATSAISSSLGGGIFSGAIAGSCIGLPLTLGAGIVLPIAATAGYISYSLLKTNSIRRVDNSMERRIDMMLPRKSLFIEIEPLGVPSHINPRSRVNKFMWGITLVTYKESCHVEMIIEGINDGFYDHNSLRINDTKEIKIGEKFIHLAHYQPGIESGLISPERLQFKTHTRTWIIPSEKIKKMLKVIQEEKLLPREARCNYNKLGIDSCLPKISEKLECLFGEPGHNCLTWAREKLEIVDIELGKSIIGFIATAPISYTKPKENYI